jgi:gliding motility-associated-like protein
LSFCFLLFLFEMKSSAQDWAWMQGSQNTNAAPNWGTQGVASLSNTPGGRLGAASWTDNNGNFWLFGGSGYGFQYLNDLWMYSPVTRMWTWVKGDNLSNAQGSYGIKGISASTNRPSGRVFSGFWEDNTGDFWLYGGSKQLGNPGDLGDLWKYEVSSNTWTWVSGTNLTNRYPVYGIQGIPDTANFLGNRYSPACWTDFNGDLWLFSGGINSSDDLWKYSVPTNEWTWVKGNKNTLGIYNFGDYGIQGIASPTNLPGSRMQAATWLDNNGNFWMFGGWGNFRINQTTAYDKNDLWKYEMATNEWTWMHGDSVAGVYDVYGTRGISDPLNKPGARYQSAAWKDSAGKFWLFGGIRARGSNQYAEFYNDLWRYDPITNEWSWHRGDNFTRGTAVYGIQAVVNSSNKPNARMVSTYWKDLEGNFWLYGGRYQNVGSSTFYYNEDLWKLSFCKTPTTPITPATATICAGSSQQLSISGGQSYQWSLNGAAISDATNATYTATQAGDYSVEIINGACRANAPNTSIITIATPPTVTVSPSTAGICAGSSQVLTANSNATNYQWSKDGVAITGATFSTYNANGAGMYSVTAYNGSCSTVSNTSVITFKPVPSSSLSPASAEICEGNVQSFTASGAASYQWMLNGNTITNATDSVYNANQNGTYSVMLYKDGCSALATNNAALTVRPNPVGVITPSSALICPPAATLLTATGGNNYQWQLNNIAINGATSSTYEAKLPGVYSVIISDGFCSAKATNNSVLTTGNAQKGIKYDVLRLIKGQSYQLTARPLGQSFTWLPSADLDNPFIQNPIITPTTSRLYQIKIETPGVCPVNDSLEVKIFLKPDVFVPSAFTPNGDGKNDVLKPIPVQIKSFGSFKVFNRWGQLIYQTKKEGEGWDGTVNGKLQPTGTYVWLFEGKDGDGNNLQLRGTTTLIR